MMQVLDTEHGVTVNDFLHMTIIDNENYINSGGLKEIIEMGKRSNEKGLYGMTDYATRGLHYSIGDMALYLKKKLSNNIPKVFFYNPPSEHIGLNRVNLKKHLEEENVDLNTKIGEFIDTSNEQNKVEEIEDIMKIGRLAISPSFQEVEKYAQTL